MIHKWSKIFMTGRIAGDFSLEKFDVTFNCFHGWPFGTLDDSTGNSRRLGHWEQYSVPCRKIERHPLEIAPPLCMGIWTPSNT